MGLALFTGMLVFVLARQPPPRPPAPTIAVPPLAGPQAPLPVPADNAELTALRQELLQTRAEVQALQRQIAQLQEQLRALTTAPSPARP